MKKHILLIIIITILQSFTTYAQTQVYSIGSSDITSSSCGPIRYGNAGSNALQLKWTSTGTGIPVSISVSLNYAVNCAAISSNDKVTFNNSYQETQPTPGPYDCNCNPSVVALTTWNLNPSDYIVGGLNVLNIEAMASSEGINVLPGYPGVYARVTVNYATPTTNQEINIKGNLTSIVNGDNTPKIVDNTDYGSSGSLVDHVFTIKNQGVNDLNLTNTPISISGGSSFSVISQPASNIISGGSSETFTVRFTPNCGGGAETAVVSIASDDADENPYTFTVKGIATADVSKPTAIAKNITVQLDATGSVTVNAEDLNDNSSDNCGISSYKIASGITGTACDLVGENSNLTLTAPAGIVFNNILYASYGNSSGSCGNFIKGYCDGSNSVSIVSAYLIGQNSGTIYASNSVFGDPCGGTPKNLAVEASYGPAVGSETSTITYSCADLGNHDVVLYVTDNNGNVSTINATITVEDKVAATVLTKDITVQLDAAGSATIVAADVDNGSSDACGTPTFVVSPDTFTCANVGPNTVTLTATDANGNISSATAVVTIEDKIAATVLTKDITVQLDATGNATIVAADIDNGSSDICGTPTLVVSPDTFTCANVGTNTVTLTATDANGNISSATAVVTIEDKIAATVLTKDITVQLDATGNATIVATDVDNGSTDICGTPTLIVSPASFTCANVGANTVTLTATDVNGNVSSQTAIVTIENKIVPTVLTKNITVQLNTTGNATIIASDIDNGSTVACGTPALVASQTTFTCANVGANTVTLTVTDANGNVSSKTATVTVQDKIGATVFTKNVTVQLDASGNAAITANQIDNGSSDVCGINAMTVTPNTFNCNNTGINTVTLTVTDVNGNITTGTATVTVQENILPIPKTQNITVELDDAGNASITANEINNGSSDNCGIASYSLNKTSFNCTNLGANTVVLTVTDKSGNIATANATVTVKSTAGDNDNDGILDNCDPDDDNDGILDAVDNCPITANQYQDDRNHNGLGDSCDEDQMNISEAFTPNGDGINDTWVISNIENYPSSVVRVFNRWGAEVFVARNYQNDWDGHAKGNSSTLPAASSYYYQIDLDGNGSIDKQGWIYINR